MNMLQSFVSNGYSIPSSSFATVGQGRELKIVTSRFPGSPGQALLPRATGAEKSIQEKLFDALASFKIFTSQVAMHFDLQNRDGLFKRLNSLLDPEEWPEGDLTPELASFRTLLRTVLVVRPKKMPGLGTSSRGRLVAAWIAGADRLTIECFSNDRLRWSLSVTEESERRAAAAEFSLKHLVAEIAPYGPQRWFS